MELVTIGRIIKPRGIKGELKVYPYTENYCMEHYCSLPFLWIGNSKKKPKKYKVIQARIFQKYFLFIFEGISNPDEALLLIKKLIFIPIEQRVKLKEGEIFIADLVGNEVFLENGQKLGIVVNFFHNGANGVCEVKRLDKKKKKILFPTTQQVLQKVYGQKKKLVIAPLEGMLDI